MLIPGAPNSWELFHDGTLPAPEAKPQLHHQRAFRGQRRKPCSRVTNSQVKPENLVGVASTYHFRGCLYSSHARMGAEACQLPLAMRASDSVVRQGWL